MSTGRPPWRPAAAASWPAGTSGRPGGSPAGRRPPPHRRRPRRLWHVVALAVALLVVTAAVATAVGLAAVYASVDVPDAFDLQPAVVVDRDGEEVGTIEPQAGRRAVELADVPEPVRDAVVAAEDGGFYRHGGVSLAGIARAAIFNVVRGEVRQGGSTISQQYVKVVTADTERTMARKVREAVLATKLERRLSKDEILERYLNNAYFGRGAYGIEAAALAFYGKGAAELEPAEGALLAGMLPAPSHLDPRVNPERGQRRYTYVVGRLADLGFADAGDYPGAPPETIERRPLEVGAAPYFLDTVRDELAEVLGGERAIFAGGLTVTSTLDLSMQRAAEAAERDVLRELDEARAAIVALEPGSGAVRALVGGRSHSTEPLNLATRAVRQPGSTFKPLALAAWLDAGRSPDERLPAPSSWRRPECVGGADACTVSNFGGAGYGSLTVREATWRSVNTVYARMGHELGNATVVEAAEAAGVPAERLDPAVEAVLGAQELTPLELAGAYNTFASDGRHHPAHTVARVERDGEAIYTADTSGERAVSETVARHVTDVLRGVITGGTGRAADIGRPAAGKTGTTSRHADAWFAGYTPDLTAAVWLGRPDGNAPVPGNPTGGGMPARAWAQFVAAALEGTEPVDFPAPGPLDRSGSGDFAPSAPDREVVPAPPADPPAPAPTTDPDPTEEPTEDPTEPVAPPPPPPPPPPPEPEPPAPDPGEPAPPPDDGGGEPPPLPPPESSARGDRSGAEPAEGSSSATT